MKKILIVFLLFLIVFFLVKINDKKTSINLKTMSEKDINIEEKRMVFVSYLEYEELLRNKSSDEIKIELNKMVDNIKKINFNTIILHVRPFSDSVYESKIFPYSSTISGIEGKNSIDILDYIIELSHNSNIDIYAWINPYRIRNNFDYKSISENNPCFKYINTDVVKEVKDKGIFYNPSSPIVEKLIIDGVSEIIENYNVDGIIYDDYFYPSSDIDLDNYNEYKKNNDISIDEYRYNIIYSLIKNTYQTIKNYDKNIIFGISPEGNIENNYNNHYLNIEKLLTGEKYLDYIMPQIYFGFENSTKPFKKTVGEWNNLIKNDIDLIPALAFYKSGNIDKYAKDGINEWIDNTNIIKREVEYIRNLSNYKGFSLFRYNSIFDGNSSTKQELINLEKILN